LTVQFSRRAVTALSEGLQSSFADSFVPGTKAAHPNVAHRPRWRSTTVGPRPDGGRHCRPPHWYESNLIFIFSGWSRIVSCRITSDSKWSSFTSFGDCGRTSAEASEGLPNSA